ncbi:MAG: penicillin-binding protein 2 [Lactobacillales bacterium]|nr:penicillin-binding protein 2 [Lactobacillales bacterium]
MSEKFDLEKYMQQKREQKSEITVIEDIELDEKEERETRSAGKSPAATEVEDKKINFNLRLHMLFFIIFTLMLALILRLSYLQVTNSHTYKQEIQKEAGQERVVTTNVARGGIFDESGKVIVGNRKEFAIQYSRAKDVTAPEILAIATKLAQYIDVPADPNLRDRDKADWYLADPEHLKAVDKRIPAKDFLDKRGAPLEPAAAYAVEVAAVTPEEMNLTPEQLEVATIFKRMNSASSMSTVFIKNEGVTQEEIAIVGERTTELDGVGVGEDWRREVTDSLTIGDFIGTVSKNGLPADKLKEYQDKGYELNDRVGTSYLEYEYEDVLKGAKRKEEITLNDKGAIKSDKIVDSGSPGDNLRLTINLDFQKQVDDILQNTYNGLLQADNSLSYADKKMMYSQGVYAVVLDVNTGGVLAASGFSHDLKTGKVSSDALGIITKNFEPGSVVKPATLTAAYDMGVISGNETQIDEPIIIQGSPTKYSIFNSGAGAHPLPVSALKALEWSSNVYMIKLVFKMMGVEYKEGMSLPLRGDLFEKLRKYYGEYGLGVLTGVDMPNEIEGFKRTGDYSYDGAMGNLLDLSFGQFDNYTPIQLAQYCATLANGGTRIAPHFVEGIYTSGENATLGEQIRKFDPKIMNKVDITPGHMGLIKQGMYNVVYGTDPYTTGKILQGVQGMHVEAKTGTAETFHIFTDEDGKPIPGKEPVPVTNSNLIAYAPAENPQVAVALMLPHITTKHMTANQEIVRDILNAYYENFIKTGRPPVN